MVFVITFGSCLCVSAISSISSEGEKSQLSSGSVQSSVRVGTKKKIAVAELRVSSFFFEWRSLADNPVPRVATLVCGPNRAGWTIRKISGEIVSALFNRDFFGPFVANKHAR